MEGGEGSQIQNEQSFRGGETSNPKEEMSNYKMIIQKLALGIFSAIVLTMVVVRTATLVAMPILNLIEKDLCLLNSTATADITSTVYSSSSQYIQRLSVIMMIIITILQWFAHGYLFCNLYKFLARKDPEEQQQQQQMYNWRHFLCRNCWKGALVILSLGTLTTASVLIIIGDVVKLVTKETALDCDYIRPNAQITTYVYYATTHFTYILKVAERWIMVCFTATVGAMWHDGYKKLQNRQGEDRNLQNSTEGMRHLQNQQGIYRDPQNSMEGIRESSNSTEGRQQSFEPPSPTEDGTVSMRTYVQVFNTTAERIKPIYKIFRSFFVFQWLVHIYLLFTQIIHLLYPWINNGTDFFRTSNTESTLLFHSNLAAIVYYALALLIAYVCGLKMNSYRRRYIRKAKLTQEQLMRHDRENKSIFTPRVPGTGLSISLESPGYMLGVVITMFGLVGALLAM